MTDYRLCTIDRDGNWRSESLDTTMVTSSEWGKICGSRQDPLRVTNFPH